MLLNQMRRRARRRKHGALTWMMLSATMTETKIAMLKRQIYGRYSIFTHPPCFP
jgi:hypothetical protein